MSGSEAERPVSRRSPEVLVPFIGLLYSGLYLIYVVAPFLGAITSSPFLLILIPFIVLFLVLAFGVWKMNRFAFVGSVVLTALFLYIEGSFALEALGNPAAYDMFFGVMTVFFSLMAAFVYSILGARATWRKGAAMKPRRMIPYSSTLALVVFGIIIGGLIVGAIAGPTEARLLAGSGQSADVSIVSGAANQNNPEFYHPTSFSATVGAPVTWVNADASTHTVTADDSSWDSGNLAAGQTYSHTFSTAGSYSYYCVIHPWMKGAVVVTP